MQNKKIIYLVYQILIYKDNNKSEFYEVIHNEEKTQISAITLIGDNISPVKVCDIINGRPKVQSKVKDDYIEFTLRYSLLHKVIKRYDKFSFKELK